MIQANSIVPIQLVMLSELHINCFQQHEVTGSLHEVTIKIEYFFRKKGLSINFNSMTVPESFGCSLENFMSMPSGHLPNELYSRYKLMTGAKFNNTFKHTKFVVLQKDTDEIKLLDGLNTSDMISNFNGYKYLKDIIKSACIIYDDNDVYPLFDNDEKLSSFEHANGPKPTDVLSGSIHFKLNMENANMTIKHIVKYITRAFSDIYMVYQGGVNAFIRCYIRKPQLCKSHAFIDQTMADLKEILLVNFNGIRFMTINNVSTYLRYSSESTRINFITIPDDATIILNFNNFTTNKLKII